MKNTIILFVIVFLLKRSEAQEYMLGVDLSYANEMNDCGAHFTEEGLEKDIYGLFADHQCEIVRLRLWHTPDSTNYSTFLDIKRSIQRAKNHNMKVLIDFHYSDTWADPASQTRPKAWSGITNITVLCDSVYNYTYRILSNLATENLLPEYVQIGNETNGNIMVEPNEPLYPLNWSRNVQLFRSGINATKAVSQEIQTVIHIADPSQANWWFSTAAENQLVNFDIIGLSYYPQWHQVDIEQVGDIIHNLLVTHHKPVWIVETGYPWTLNNNGDASNILGEASLLPGYVNPPTTEGQKNFLINLTYEVITKGGMGVLYWEPAWVSTTCTTSWGVGSHYENATFFNFDNQLHEGIEFLSYDYSQAPHTSSQVAFYVDMTGVDVTDGVFVTGDFTGDPWTFSPMTSIGNHVYTYQTTMQKGSEGAFIFTKNDDWNMNLYHEQVPLNCALFWDTHRKYNILEDQENYAFAWSSCETIPLAIHNIHSKKMISAYPNPFNNKLTINLLLHTPLIRIVSTNGKVVAQLRGNHQCIDTSTWKSGTYIIQWINNQGDILESVKINKIHHTH